MAVLLVLFSQHWQCSPSAVNISYLPGFHGVLPFRLETGYVSIDKKNEAELFYYFVESERNPVDDPLILWLPGGPGCSGLVGLALHMGPLQFKVNNFDDFLPTLTSNPYSWTKIANMLFLDWPIGTGFSYSKNENDYIKEDFQAKKQIYNFLVKWFLDHPRFLSNAFYMGGESYGGKMATLLAHDIVEGNKQANSIVINIKGYIIGNAVTDEYADKNSQVPHAYGLGIIPSELYKNIQTNCEGEDYRKPIGKACAEYLEVFKEFLSEINVFGVLDPKCSDDDPLSQQSSCLENTKDKLLLPSNLVDSTCITPDLLSNYWANNDAVRAALKIKKGTVTKWVRCNFNFALNIYNRSIPSSVPYHIKLTTSGYHALVYSGDHDLQLPFFGTLEWIKSLGFSILDDWRSWHVGGQVAGYTMLFSNNLTFATVKGGNHLAPIKRPKECLAMLDRWISHELL
ncbi:hypothetical protein HPP92_007711 [Vanilla planifolia]|uniref:Carboxypeptidase n=1 Tax=Vanilla planifolia TaxID=51239 RepID=A0A835RAY7_VANPL|nr:hypothetical protein HPP92_007711 [Vanilla planifolia]